MAAPKELPVLFRSLEIHLEGRTEGDDRIPVSLSSPVPVDRWFGKEILTHTKEAVDMSRAKRGLPLLLNHDTGEQIGRIEELKIDGDKLRGLMRFSRSPEAQQIRQDVLDGIRQETSIGYRVREMKLVSSDEAGDTYECTRWTPLEGSLVAVPADETVGVGRSAEGTAAPVTTIVPNPAPLERALPSGGAMSDKETPTPAAAGGEDRGKNERERSLQIMRMAREHKMEPKLEEWLGSERTADQVRVEILDAIKAAALAAAPGLRTGTMEGLGLAVGERKKYSLCRAIMAAADGSWKQARFEEEISEELTKQATAAGYKPRGHFMVPVDLGIEQRAGLDSKSTSAGLELKFTEPGSLIELLRNSTKVMGLGATFLTGLQGNIAFPRQIGAGTFSWVAENPGSDTSDSNATLDQVSMAPKMGQSTSSYSRNLLTQAVIDVEQFVRQDIALITAIALDLASLSGTGASNQPKGIVSQTGVGTVTMGANGGQPIWDTMVDLEKVVEQANALRGALAYLTTPGIKARLKKVAQISASTGIPVWWQGEVNGYPAEGSTNMRSNLTKGTSTTICHEVLFGNWAELLIGQWNALDMIVDPYRLKKQAMIEITSYVSIDVAVRHGASFAYTPDALP